MTKLATLASSIVLGGALVPSLAQGQLGDCPAGTTRDTGICVVSDAGPLGPSASQARGSEAVRDLGAGLPALAAEHSMRPSDLREMLLEDTTVWLDASDDLFVVEPAVPASILGSAGETAVASGPAPQAAATDEFALHSLPGAARRIYLDFNGHVATGTAWNNSFGATITSAPFTLDADAETFNAEERAVVASVWARVAEDFASFQVDVTTEDPGAEALRRSGPSDVAWGKRIVISPTNFYSTNAGGVAYVGSFASSVDVPGYVFTDQLGKYTPYIAEATSHEAGHTVGLWHDGTSALGYYSGHNTWAPIMGVGYGKKVVQWSAGEYTDANNTEDDLTIITNYLPRRIDEHGDTAATATPVELGVATGGVITTRTDVDVFRVEVAAGTIAVTATPAEPSPDLDIEVELLDSAGQVLATADPAGATTATISRAVAEGTYFIRVDGVGVDTATTGYSDYGSIGAFTISVTGSTPTTTTTTTATTTTSTTTTTTAPTTTTSTTTTTTAPTTTTTTTLAPPTTVRPTTTTTLAPSRPKVVSVTRLAIVKGTGALTAQVKMRVVTKAGDPVAGARIVGRWGGRASGLVTLVTGKDGSALSKRVTLDRTGRATFSVLDVFAPQGYRWDRVAPTASARLSR